MTAFVKPVKPASRIRIAPPIPTQPETSPQDLTNLSLDILHQFLSYVDQDAAALLPLPERTQVAQDSQQSQLPISEWDILYTASTPPVVSEAVGFSSSIVVRSHPDPNRHLFCVQSTIPGVTARQFWSLMASAENRKLWDTTVEDGSVKRWIANTGIVSDATRSSTAIADALAARIESFRFGSIFMVAKARDMVLLSVDARLPPNTSSMHSSNCPEDGPLRLVSTSQSVVDPSLPPRKGYTRFELQTGGFMVEDLGDDGVPESACRPAAETAASPTASKGGAHMAKGLRALGRRGRSASGSKHLAGPGDPENSPSFPKAPLKDPRGPAVLVTQVSDLGEMAAWVPSSVIRMVASTLVPRSIASVVKVAKSMPVSSVLYQNYTRLKPEASSSNETEQLGKNTGEWYRHRILPAMIGQGILRKSTSAPAPNSSVYNENAPLPTSSNPVVLAAPKALSHLKVPETVQSSEIRSFADNMTNILPSQADDVVADVGTSRGTAPIPHIPLAASPPPRTSSLPGTPVLNRVVAPISSSPSKPLSPSSPTKRQMGMMDRLPNTARSAQAPSEKALPSALGLHSASDAAFDDLVNFSSMSPSRFRSKALAQTRIEATEAPVESRASGRSNEHGSNAQKLPGSLYPAGQVRTAVRQSATNTCISSQQSGILRGKGNSSTDAKYRSKTVTTSADDQKRGVLPTSPISPAEKRSRMLSNEYYAVHSNGDSVALGSSSAAMDRKVQRLSNALVAEMERRQLSPPAASPISHSGKLLPSASVAEPVAERQASADLVALLADALSESLPFMPENQNRVRDQARRVSALLLSGSDALAYTLAPGARDSLGLQFDTLSTSSERSEHISRASATNGHEPAKTAVSAKYPSNLGIGSGQSAKHTGAGKVAVRNRKPSIDTAARSISVSASQANVSAFTESVISSDSRRSDSNSEESNVVQQVPARGDLRKSSDGNVGPGASTASGCTSPSSRKTYAAYTSTSASENAETSGSKHETKAVETLRELNRASQRSSRPVKRSLATQSARAKRSGYGASLLGGLAYYSGYSWYSSTATSTHSSQPSTASSDSTTRSPTNGTRPVSTTKKQVANGSIRSTAAARGRIPNQYSITRRRSRANYPLENNAKLHPFPASFGRRSRAEISGNGSVKGQNSVRNASHNRASILPPPISGLGVGVMRRLPTQTEHPAHHQQQSTFTTSDTPAADWEDVHPITT